MQTSLSETIRSWCDGQTLLIADDFSFERASRIGRTVPVDDCTWEHVDRVIADEDYRAVVAIGGCSSLDFGRAVAAGGSARLTVIPTILSTSCIANDRSVIYHEGFHSVLRTTAPDWVVLSNPVLRGGDFREVSKWFQSGVGDLMANVSACVDYLIRHGQNVTMGSILTHARQAHSFFGIGGMDTVYDVDQDMLQKLAVLIYFASREVINMESMERSAAGEHDLYYTLKRYFGYRRDVQTHGRVVSIGTLLTLQAHALESGESAILDHVVAVFRRAGLPLNYDQLMDIEVHREELIDALESIKGSGSLLAYYYAKFGPDLLDISYGESRA